VPPVRACIPTIGLSPDLDNLVEYLRHKIDRVELYVNSPEVPDHVGVYEAHKNVYVFHRPGLNIYHEWNEGVRCGGEAGAYVLVLNDDIVVPDGFEISLHDALDGQPDYALLGVAGTSAVNQPPYSVTPVSHQAGNRYAFSAWAFIARPSMWTKINESYEIWYGDDDMIWEANARGHKVGMLHGLGVEHHVSTSIGKSAWTIEAAGRDGVRWSDSH
jgi:GT2 family glycosyltransferase